MCSCTPYLLSMAALDSGQLLGRMLRSFVDLVTAPTVDAVAVPPSASVQAPPPSMNVEVNVSAVNPEPGTSWWHAHDDQGWWSWGKPVLKARPCDVANSDAHWKSLPADYGSWKSHGHSYGSKPLEDQWPSGRGNSKRWKADHEQWKRPPAVEDLVPPGDGVSSKPPQVPAFPIPCRNYYLRKCAFADKCNFLHSSLTSISD